MITRSIHIKRPCITCSTATWGQLNEVMTFNRLNSCQKPIGPRRSRLPPKHHSYLEKTTLLVILARKEVGSRDWQSHWPIAKRLLKRVHEWYNEDIYGRLLNTPHSGDLMFWLTLTRTNQGSALPCSVQSATGGGCSHFRSGNYFVTYS